MKINKYGMAIYLIAVTLGSNAMANELEKPKKVLGYNVFGCQSEFRSHDKNLCSEKVLNEVISKSKNMKAPNFDNGKKLIQYFHTFNNEKLTEIFVIDDKTKNIDIRLAPAHGKIWAMKDSNLICLQKQGSYFELDYTPTAENPFYMPETDETGWACANYHRTDSYWFDTKPTLIEPTKKSYQDYNIKF